MIQVYYLIVFFLFGIVLGSFYNVVGLRLPKGKSFHAGRSYCPNCKKTLLWYELIPIISYLLQRGKCTQCKTKISIIYPIIEMMTGALFAFSYWYFGFQVELFIAILLMSMLMIIFVSDITFMIIPNKILLFFLPIFVVLRIVEPLEPWYDSIIGGLVGYTLIATIIIVSKGGMGAGDMKLFGLLGIILGLHTTLLTFFLSALLGAIVGLILKAMNKVKKRQPIAFGPYIIIATIISYYYGNKLIGFYLNLFL